MRDRPPFRYCEPTFWSGLLDDPVLLVHARPLGESLLFDCGQIHHLAKRVLKHVAALFISHAHMDHFMGIDTFIRHNHVSPRTVDIYGPPGIASRVAHKLSGYDWNLAEPYWCTFRVHEVGHDRIASFTLPGSEGFPCHPAGGEQRDDRVIHRNAVVQVEAELCDHRIPALVFRITERPTFLVDGEKVAALGLLGGDWLRLLKKLFYEGKLAGEPLTVLRQQGESVTEETVTDAAALYERIRRIEAPASIGYLTDIGFNAENLGRIGHLLTGVTLLVCECSFLAADMAKARVSHHLCTADLNELAERLRPRYLLPMHLSKSYQGRSHLLYEELTMPAGVTLLRLPDHITPRPLLPDEVPRIGACR